MKARYVIYINNADGKKEYDVYKRTWWNIHIRSKYVVTLESYNEIVEFAKKTPDFKEVELYSRGESDDFYCLIQ